MSVIDGTSGDDVLLGDDQDNLIQGGVGDDTLAGAGGHDLVDGGSYGGACRSGSTWRLNSDRQPALLRPRPGSVRQGYPRSRCH